MHTKPKVLFVDDDLLLIKAVELITRSSDFDFRLTTSVDEARRMLRTEEFQIVFSDYHMPVCNGVDFLAEAAYFSPKSVRILVSASLKDELAKLSLEENHIFTFLKKPFGRDSFNERLAEAVKELAKESN